MKRFALSRSTLALLFATLSLGAQLHNESRAQSTVNAATAIPSNGPSTGPSATASDSRKVVLVVGDSLSAGYGIQIDRAWPTLLDQRLKSQGYGYRVVNASVSGETSAGAESRLARLLELHRPAIVILEIGANDGLRGLPLAQTRKNLTSMLDKAASRQASVLLVGMQMPPNYGAIYADGFYALFGELARARKLSLVPFLLDGVALDPGLMQGDGLHPTAAAQPRLLDNVWRVLQPMLKKK